MRISDWSSDVCSSDLRRQSDDDAASQPRMAGDAGAASARLRRFRLFGARSRSRALRRRGGGEPYAAVRRARRGGIEIFVYGIGGGRFPARQHLDASRSEEHTSEHQSLMRIPYAGIIVNKTSNIIEYSNTKFDKHNSEPNV